MAQPLVALTIAGERINLTRTDVESRLRGVAPGRISRHAVEIAGQLFPVKEAFSVTTGLDVMDFNTNQARTTFKKLGFPVTRVR